MYQTGDIIKASINKIPFIYHYGIILVKDGQEAIIHNSPNEKNNYGGNILVYDLQEFFKSRKIVHVQRTNISKIRILKIVDKYKSMPFSLLAFNCEHFIFEIRDGRPHSPQIKDFVYNFITVLMIIYMIRNRILLKKAGISG